MRELVPHLRLIELEHKRVLLHAYDPVETVYFPHRGVVSMTVPMRDGTTVEGATIGPEGLVGISALLPRRLALSEAVVQVSGTASQIDAAQLRDVLVRTPRLKLILERFTEALMRQLLQTVACNNRHSIEMRFARWLLLAHDRAESDSFNLTHEFLAEMLAVRRASVTQIARRFQDANLIRYGRGNIEVLDRRRLEATACECYAHIREVTEAIFAP
jgi:CRP-like cAMP-binding protein